MRPIILIKISIVNRAVINIGSPFRCEVEVRDVWSAIMLVGTDHIKAEWFGVVQKEENKTNTIRDKAQNSEGMEINNELQAGSNDEKMSSIMARLRYTYFKLWRLIVLIT